MLRSGGVAARGSRAAGRARAAHQYVSLCTWDNLFRAYFLAVNVGDATGLLEHLRGLFYKQSDVRFGG
jgi:hypothetical protein